MGINLLEVILKNINVSFEAFFETNSLNLLNSSEFDGSDIPKKSEISDSNKSHCFFLENDDTHSLGGESLEGGNSGDMITPSIIDETDAKIINPLEVVDPNGNYPEANALDEINPNVFDDEFEFWDPSTAKSLNSEDLLVDSEPTSLALEKNIQNFQETQVIELNKKLPAQSSPVNNGPWQANNEKLTKSYLDFVNNSGVNLPAASKAALAQKKRK